MPWPPEYPRAFRTKAAHLQDRQAQLLFQREQTHGPPEKSNIVLSQDLNPSADWGRPRAHLLPTIVSTGVIWLRGRVAGASPCLPPSPSQGLWTPGSGWTPRPGPAPAGLGNLGLQLALQLFSFPQTMLALRDSGRARPSGSGVRRRPSPIVARRRLIGPWHIGGLPGIQILPTQRYLGLPDAGSIGAHRCSPFCLPDAPTQRSCASCRPMHVIYATICART